MTALTVVKGGISRERLKGAARSDVLYDLVNGYVTNENTVVVRPGTFRRAVLPASTKGLCAFDDSIHIFAAESVSVPEGYTLHVLVHPMFEDGSENPFPIKQIHFCAPFLGFLYVVAEFDVGDVDTPSTYHFWLQSGGTWQANKVYKHGDVVEPSTPNGMAYQATRLGSPSPSWAPNQPRTLGDIVEPTTYNDFYYTVVDTIGDNPISGSIEPEWPTEDGAQIFEDTEGVTEPNATTSEPPSNVPGSDTTDRYGIPGPNNGVQP